MRANFTVLLCLKLSYMSLYLSLLSLHPSFLYFNNTTPSYILGIVRRILFSSTLYLHTHSSAFILLEIPRCLTTSMAPLNLSVLRLQLPLPSTISMENLPSISTILPLSPLIPPYLRLLLLLQVLQEQRMEISRFMYTYPLRVILPCLDNKSLISPFLFVPHCKSSSNYFTFPQTVANAVQQGAGDPLPYSVNHLHQTAALPIFQTSQQGPPPPAPPAPPGVVPWQGPTTTEVQARCTPKTQQFIPYNPTLGPTWWCKELDGSYTERTTNDIMHNCQPGRWGYAAATNHPYFIREPAGGS